MPESTSRPDEYLLGHSANEEERLRRLPQVLAADSNRFLDHLGIRSGAQTLDIGCGPQGILDLLSERVGPSGKVVGVEQNESTVQLARQFAEQRQLRNVEVLHGDAKATGLPRSSFDLVHARLVLVNVPEPQRVVDEMIALARPGGVVASHEVDWGMSLCDPSSPAWDGLVRLWEEYSRSKGADVFVGRKTAQMLRAGGLLDVQIVPRIHAYPLGNTHRYILCDLLENVRDQILKQGLLTEVEFREQINDLKRHLDDANTLVIPHLFFQAWGKRAE